MPESSNIYDRALICLMSTVPTEKVTSTTDFNEALLAGKLSFQSAMSPVREIVIPGRPENPRLIDGKDVPRRGLGSVEGRIALLHALAHIEFNAINLALDAVYRFRSMPHQFVRDWARVASEEAFHFSLLNDRLATLGSTYGELPAHNGLWDMAVRTDHDPLVRMALVPRVLEARGLDVAPAMIEKLRTCGDQVSADILQTIYQDEIDHVRIGNHWFVELCRQRDLQAQVTFIELLKEFTQGFLRGPFNLPARTRAGFSEAELRALDTLDANKIAT